MHKGIRIHGANSEINFRTVIEGRLKAAVGWHGNSILRMGSQILTINDCRRRCQVHTAAARRLNVQVSRRGGAARIARSSHYLQAKAFNALGASDGIIHCGISSEKW